MSGKAMDNFLLQIIVNELGMRIGGHRIGGIYQIGSTDLGYTHCIYHG